MPEMGGDQTNLNQNTSLSACGIVHVLVCMRHLLLCMHHREYAPPPPGAHLWQFDEGLPLIRE